MRLMGAADRVIFHERATGQGHFRCPRRASLGNQCGVVVFRLQSSKRIDPGPMSLFPVANTVNAPRGDVWTAQPDGLRPRRRMSFRPSAYAVGIDDDRVPPAPHVSTESESHCSSRRKGRVRGGATRRGDPRSCRGDRLHQWSTWPGRRSPIPLTCADRHGWTTGLRRHREASASCLCFHQASPGGAPSMWSGQGAARGRRLRHRDLVVEHGPVNHIDLRYKGAVFQNSSLRKGGT